jgi:hypothetical protein
VHKQDRNIILSHTFEYRPPAPPSASKLRELAAKQEEEGEGAGTVTLDMTSRYMGLVVVPGEYIVRIEVEEFVSQMKGKFGVGTGDGISGMV